jgi:NUMOD4 motif
VAAGARVRGFYEVSDQGRVYSLPRAATRGGLLRLSVNSRGYRHAALSKYGQVRVIPVGRLVLAAFVRQPRAGERARHGAGGPGDDSVPNLRWGLVYGLA